MEDIRSEMLSPKERKAFQETFISVYEFIVLTCLKLRKKEEEFNYAKGPRAGRS